ncbi:MAG: ATP-binding protein [Bacteroidota bacterium]
MQKRILVTIVISWILVVLISLVLNIISITNSNEQIENYNKGLVNEISNTFFNDIVINKLWNELHEGTYISDSSTNINDNSDSKNITINGKNWKKVNISIFKKWLTTSNNSNGVLNLHYITNDSVNNFQNIDSWEQRAYSQIIAGELSVCDRIDDNQSKLFRFMAPIKANDNCMKCHTNQNFKSGDIIGALSVTVDRDKIPHNVEIGFLNVILIHILLFVIGLIIIYYLNRYLDNQIIKITNKNFEFEKEIKERKLAQISLNESEKRYKSLVENQSVLIFRMLPDFIIAYTNPAFILFFNITSITVEGKKFSDYIYNEDTLEVQNVISNLNIYNKNVSIEHRVISKTNEVRWLNSTFTAVFNSDNQIMEIISVCQDITNLKNLEEIAITNEKFIKESQSIAHLGNWEFDIESMQFKWSEEVYKIFGLIPTQSTPSFDEFISMMHSDDKVNYLNAVDEAVINGIPYEFDYRFYLPDMTLRYAFAIGKPIFNEKDKVVKLIGTIMDITERKLAEDELKSAMIKAEDATKAKSRFLANMSHEIRTPLNHIVGMAEILKSTKLLPEQLDNLDIINTSANNLLSIINDILDFSKIEAGKMEISNEKFDLHKVVNDIIKLIKFKTDEKRIKLDLVIDSDVPITVIGDAVRLNQILLNLTNNSVKFTEKGSIGLTVKKLSEKDNILTFLFNVSDTGIGISPQMQEILFHEFTQEFSSNTRKYGGTGLGLAISKRLTEMMGGEIGVKSEIDKGSEFWFTVNLNKYIPKEIDDNPVLVEALKIEKKPGLKLLLAEDNLINQRIAKIAIEKLGHSVEIADNGKIAFEKYKQNDFDMILMDIQMPEMDGISATKAIREYEREHPEKKYIKIIAMTANVMKEDQELYIQTEMDNFISKPFKQEELGKILERTKTINQQN